MAKFKMHIIIRGWQFEHIIIMIIINNSNNNNNNNNNNTNYNNDDDDDDDDDNNNSNNFKQQIKTLQTKQNMQRPNIHHFCMYFGTVYV